MKYLYSFLLLIVPLTIHADSHQFIKELLENGVTVDLKNPEYKEGVLETDQGGVVTGKEIRIQAKNILYTKKAERINEVEAEGDLRVDYGCYTLVGEKITYDFITNTGVIYNGRSGKAPWFFGGEKIILHYDGDLDVVNGYLTTSENIHHQWEIKTARIHLDQNRYLTARNIQFRFFNTPIFWLPSLRTNLNYILDNPIRYRIRYGGKQGVRLGMTYQLINWDTFKTNIRFDYRIKRGPGIGLETDYCSPNRRERFQTINYIANDPSIEKPRSKTRYRMAGLYHNNIVDNRFSVRGSHDKLSDKYMARDYYDRGLDLKTAYRTYLNIRRQFDNFLVANLSTQLRVNDFQTVKQELPVLTTTLHPLSLGCTGIVAEAQSKVGFLDFKYADDVQDVPDYHSGRIEFRSRIYRPFCAGPLTITPEANYLTIFYSNSPTRDDQWLQVSDLSTEIKTGFYKKFRNFKHTIEPYASYHYMTRPCSSPTEHYIFDINDGIDELNLFKFGVRNLLFFQNSCYQFVPSLTADSYAYAFINTPTVPITIPRYYTDFIWSPYPTLRHILTSGWDAERGIVDHFNFRSEWTVNSRLAFAAEYRHRSAFAWRKADHTNFILESFQPESALRNSLLSDRRDTFIYHLFYRVNLSLAFQLKQRFGWGRSSEPAYKESQFDTLIKLPAAWNLRISYRNKETEHRVALYISLGINQPK